MTNKLFSQFILTKKLLKRQKKRKQQVNSKLFRNKKSLRVDLKEDLFRKVNNKKSKIKKKNLNPLQIDTKKNLPNLSFPKRIKLIQEGKLTRQRVMSNLQAKKLHLHQDMGPIKKLTSRNSHKNQKEYNAMEETNQL